MSPVAIRLIWTLAICGILVPTVVYANSAFVPDDFPTIQQAIDSGADTVQVRGGTYSERPLVDHSLTLLGFGGSGRPRIEGLDVINRNFLFNSRTLLVSECSFSQSVNLTTVTVTPRNLDLRFSNCVLDSGVSQLVKLDTEDIATLTIDRCHLGGRSAAQAFEVFMEADTVDGGVFWATHGASIDHCWFTGGTNTAITLTDTPRRSLTNSHIEHYDTGIYAEAMDAYEISNNIINDCATGIILHAGTDAVVAQNTILTCNIAIDVGGGDNLSVTNNTIVHNRRAGIRLRLARFVAQHNVIGFTNGPGIIIDNPTDAHVSANTIFAGDSSGIVVSRNFGYPVTVMNNILAANKAYGIWTQLSPVQLGCNDYFANGLGPTDGIAVDATDVALDPMFCDMDSVDVRLTSHSPLASVPGCGTIGALAIGCGMTATLLEMFTATPQGHSIAVRWQFSPTINPACWLERAMGEHSRWSRIGAATPTDHDGYVVIDSDVQDGRTYSYRIGWLDAGRIGYSSAVVAALGTQAPAGRVFPNPSRGPVRIEWTLARPDQVNVRVYDLTGRVASTVGSAFFPAGNNSVQWDGRRADGTLAPPGWYVVRFRLGTAEASQMLLLLR